MTLRLVVHRTAWHEHVARVSSRAGDLLPVVKGNGYGFGRPVLMAHAARMSGTVAVGSVFEVDDVPAGTTPLVLTPVGDALPDALPHSTIFTVGSRAHVDQLVRHGATPRVVVKVASTMQRFGVAPADASELASYARTRGCEPVAWSIHPTLAGTDDDRTREAISLASHLDPGLPLHLSHVVDGLGTVRSALPRHGVVARLGTALWLGDKSMLQLQCDVLERREYVRGTTLGYRGSSIDEDGHLLVVGAGTAHGVTVLPDGRCPFHFERTRLALVEPPHMHVSMLFVPAGQPTPYVGDRIDVQQPMTRVAVDLIDWVS
jgi:alanine racemase